jgi:hypothetical protein
MSAESVVPEIPLDWAEIAWNKLTLDQRQRAVNILQAQMSSFFFDEIRERVEQYGLGNWLPAGWHHLQGMNIRNELRHRGFLDRHLPPLPEIYGRVSGTFGNWDDYYIQAIEAAAGARPIATSYDGPVYVVPPRRSLWQRLWDRWMAWYEDVV